MLQEIKVAGAAVIASAIIFSPGCGRKSEMPERVTVTRKALYPEGVAWDTTRRKFMLSSLTEGSVGHVNDRGEYRRFISDSRLISSIGIQIDLRNGRVLVCNSDPGVSKKSSKKTKNKLAALGIYSLKDGSPLHYIELSRWLKGKHFANDLTLDDQGNIYVTDSYAPIIYKVDKQGNPWVFLEHDRFKGEGFNLNGIVYHQDGYLLVAKYNEGIIFRIPVKNPRAFSQVVIPEAIHGVDGLLWGSDGSLVAIANESGKQTNRIFKMVSDDNWESARITGEKVTGRVFATTGTIRNGDLYILHAKLHRLFNENDRKLKKFRITRTVFRNHSKAAK